MSTTRGKTRTPSRQDRSHGSQGSRRNLRTPRSTLGKGLCNPPRRRRRITRPEAGSLYDIMHDHAGESLYVVPICWTDRHATLLGTKWHALEPITTPVPDIKAHAHLEPSLAAKDLTASLNTLLDSQVPTQRTCAIKSIMSFLFPTTLCKAKTSAELDMYFGNRMFRKAVRVAVLWKNPEYTGASFDSAVTRSANASSDRIPGSTHSSQASGNHPILAYVNRTQLSNIRQCLYRVMPAPSGVQNIPVSQLQQLRSKMLKPADIDQDSHYLGIMIAMAQARFYGESSSRASSQSSWRSNRSGTMIDAPEDFHDVKVQLITHNDSTQEFLVYTATVTTEFLQRFAQPHKVPKSDDDERMESGIQISYARVPIWPLLGLKERLGKALGREIAGDSASNSADCIDMWDQLIAQEKLNRPDLKRRRTSEREALAEVLNRSFEIEVEEDVVPARDNTPSLSPEKRRKLAQTIKPLEVC